MIALMSIGMFACAPGIGADAPQEPRSEILYVEGGGERIEGVLYLPAERRATYPTVILAHGFGCNYSYLTANIARELAQRGFAAYAFNFRNPDTRSMLNTSVLTEARTLHIVIDQLKQSSFVDASRLYLLGESQGGFVAAYVAAQRAADPALNDICALVLYYPAFVLQDDARRRDPDYQRPGYVYPEIEVVGNNTISGTYTRDALSFDIYDMIAAYKNDVLIVHGTADAVVPLSYSERAVETYAHAELKVIPGAPHGYYDKASFDAAVGYTLDFLAEH